MANAVKPEVTPEAPPSSAPAEPSVADLDGLVHDLERSWMARLTVRRQAADDIGYREIYLSLDGEPLGVLHNGQTLTREIQPGPHELRAHNTLFRRSLSFAAKPGEHARFMAVNRPGWGTHSTLALVVGFLGAGPIMLTLAQETDAEAAPPPQADEASGGHTSRG
jgi:hypothetical protein